MMAEALTNAGSCPHCDADMSGEKMTAAQRESHGGTHFSRTIGVEIRGVYDGVLFWLCPDCDRPWNRWAHPDRLHYEAAYHMALWNDNKREDKPK